MRAVEKRRRGAREQVKTLENEPEFAVTNVGELIAFEPGNVDALDPSRARYLLAGFAGGVNFADVSQPNDCRFGHRELPKIDGGRQPTAAKPPDREEHDREAEGERIGRFIGSRVAWNGAAQASTGRV